AAYTGVEARPMNTARLSPAALPPRKARIRRWSKATASERARWRRHAAFFHSQDLHYLKFLIPEGTRVLELGCCTGDLLAGLKLSFGVGVDLNGPAIEEATRVYPAYMFYAGDIESPEFIESLPGPFDYIVIVDTLGALDDCQLLFENLHRLCTRE